jgi:hypothetical protein
MRTIPCALGTIALIVLLGAEPGQAQGYPWCAYLKLPGGATNCGFATEAQCRAAASGVGGYCYRNTGYQPQAGEPRTRRPFRQPRG